MQARPAAFRYRFGRAQCSMWQCATAGLEAGARGGERMSMHIRTGQQRMSPSREIRPVPSTLLHGGPEHLWCNVASCVVSVILCLRPPGFHRWQRRLHVRRHQKGHAPTPRRQLRLSVSACTSAALLSGTISPFHLAFYQSPRVACCFRPSPYPICAASKRPG